MQFLLHPAKKVLLLPSIREFTASTFLFQPIIPTKTGLSDPKQTIEKTDAQKQRTDSKAKPHWEEINATVSEADVGKLPGSEKMFYTSWTIAFAHKFALGQS
jgi:hypothetical protein